MKSLKRLIIIALLTGIVYLAYQYFLMPTDRSQAIYFVPDNAVYIIETDKPIDNWQKIRNSSIWTHLRKNNHFSELTESLNKLDSTIQNNSSIFKLAGSRKLLISAHMYKPNNAAFLYIIDLKKTSKLLPVKDYLNIIVGDDYIVTKRTYHEQEIIELFDKKDRKTLYLSFINNLLIASYTHLLVEASIDQHNEPVIGRDINYLEINKRIAGDGMFKLYVQYAFLDDYLMSYLERNNELVNDLSHNLYYSGLSFDLDDEGLIKMNGYTNINDTIESSLLSILRSGRGELDILQVAPKQTALYFGIGFNSMLTFYENFEDILSKDQEKFLAYQANIDKIEKLLKINVKEHFISWIDNEIALMQLQPADNGIDNELAVVLKAKNINTAKENLAFIQKQIKKNTPVKFKKVNYNGYTINYLSIKGFFKLLFGKLFAKLEKPYYTIIGDFVIFSNHPQTLENIIDDYNAGNTLIKSDEFKVFFDNFNEASNIFVYINTPVLHQNLEGFVNAETWADLNKNKDYIICFSQIGFQLEKFGDMFETKLVSQFKTFL